MIYLSGEEIRIQVKIEIEGKLYKQAHIIDKLGWEDCAPPNREPIDAIDAYDAMQRAEKRRRLTDMIASKIAYALFSAIQNHYKEKTKG